MREPLWPAPYNQDTLEAVTEFVLLCKTWDETAKKVRRMPDKRYIRRYVKRWYLNRKRNGTLITEKCRRMVISWASRACELWDMGLRRCDGILAGEDLEAAAKQMWRYSHIYNELKAEFPEWKLPPLETHKYQGDRLLKDIEFGNGSRVSYANGQSGGVQGDGVAFVVMEEFSIYPYAASFLAQAKIITQGEAGQPLGYVHGICNAKADNKNWQSVKKILKEGLREEEMKGMAVTVSPDSLEWFLELDWFADDARDENWLKETRLSMRTTPFEFEEQILRLDARTQGALWESAVIDASRVELKDLPDLVCIGVGLDPSVSDPEMRKNPSKEVDECGIIVGGVCGNAQGWVLNDLSGRFKPSVWARIACHALQKYAKSTNAARYVLIAEKNQGGELVRDALLAVWPNAPVVLVSASIGKRARAEPLEVLYEQGRIHHVGRHPQLESEMVSWNAQNPTSLSPGRIDALVWLFTGLGLCGEMEVRTTSRLNNEAK